MATVNVRVVSIMEKGRFTIYATVPRHGGKRTIPVRSCKVSS